ncbi:substrate-binding domain-containing protein [Pelosinus sp. sgz500959]|uniref:substrate-binding domain-containing protein n=1 Tax=Pelosinus sp. sgz500959 TaxID=3242472 RepID=UPI00366F3966
MKVRKKLSLLLAGALMITSLTVLSGCGKSEQSSAPKTDQETLKKKIGVSLLTKEHVFFNKIEEAIKAEAKVKGLDVIIMDGGQDSNKQMSQLQDFITQKVDAIALAPASSSGIEPGIALAKKANIPLFTFDVSAKGDVVSHIATDNKEGGRIAGQYMGEKILNGKGKVAIVTYSEVESCVNREEGFKEAIAKFPGIQIVDVQNSSGSAEKAANVTQDMLLKNPDLDAIFAVGDPFAVGALSAIRAAGKKVKIVGFDGNPEGIAEIKKNDLWIADIAQNPDEIGKAVVDSIKDKLDGKPVDAKKLIAPFIIDASNLK